MSTTDTRPDVPTGSDAPDEPELIGFELTHSLFRAELPRLARAFATPSMTVADAQVVEDHLRVVTEHLERHHQEEDAFHWPLLAERAPELTDVLHRLEAEHASLDDHLVVILDRSAGRPERAAALSALTSSLTDHFDDEDRLIIPALRRHITAAEQAGSMERSRSKIPASDELRILSLMLAAGTDAERDRMLAVLPEAVIDLWRTVGAPDLAEVHRRLP